MLEICNLQKQYPSPDGQTITALRLDNLRLERGEQAALVGPSGSGKTTLLHLVAGLLAPTAGTISLDGQRVDALREKERDVWRARNVGYVFQSFNLLPNLSALENVMAALVFARVERERAARLRAMELLRGVGLADRVHNRPSQLSIGEQQRVAVARALANRPRLILADEPTASLDRENGRNVLEILQWLCREQQSILILATHDHAVMELFPRRIELARAVEVSADAPADSVA
ncbi:putative ABC transport system ATP-binding protein [Hydrogenispora ethanolica]|uniref:Putative ABC transport system ATP-binding protein n=2 Tax=Hydrogenispora ethanolica TaxID=1082276 RepID=A0A4R1SBQ3_HYDET|nr:putative ABC transport system ATP-binding protein [Hydrogenispora ethanolica]